MITSKQRAQLRGIANGIETIVHIGKGGINENIVKQAEDALKAREIIKCHVLENSPLTPREACTELAQVCGAEEVQVIGGKFVIYKQNAEKPVIQLIKDKKKG